MSRQISLQPGDIFATEGKGPAGWAVRNLISPSTDRFHFGILWKKLPNNDFIILESIRKGLAVGKLSWYSDRDIVFYRVDCPWDLRSIAANGLVDYGRAMYDFMLIPKIVVGIIAALFEILTKERKIRKPTAEDFPYGENSSLICTEAVDIAYDSVGVNIIPEGVIPLPNAFKQAELDGRISQIHLASFLDD